ncbi:MAG TPA: POTRA domain-containing protein, partial [Candidatus Eisenbacteria bacterium]|nr:POTRA domain-containing protein [Candidatus Eisenbacteria bacterium]
NFLYRNGYFQAEVKAQPAIDDRHKIVNVSFATVIGKRAKISSVSIEGASEAEKVRLLHSVESLRARLSRALLKPGKPYSRGRIASAQSLMKKALSGQHRLASSVKENPPKYDPETNRVAVSFTVEVGPVVTIRTEGAKLTVIPFLGGRQTRKLIPVYAEGAVDRELVEEGERNLTDYFQKKGYYDAKVTTDFQNEPDEISIVYKIDRGKKHKVDRIIFHGNYAIGEKDLSAQMTVKKSHIWTHGSLSQSLLKQSASNIEALYRDRGYEDVKVTPRTVDREPKIDVDFDIEEGPQTIVDDVQVTGNQKIARDQLTAPKGFQLRAGDPFSPRKMADDRNRMSANYLNRGYLNVEVKATAEKTKEDPNRVKVSYAITENQMVRMDDIVYLGQERTKLSLLQKTAQMKPETPMRRQELMEAESRLYDLTIFDWATVGPRKPITNQTDETALVKVHEAKRNEITYGFGFEVSHRGGNAPSGTVAIPGGGGTIGLNGYEIAPSQSTFASPRGVIEFTRRNMRGLAETASASI